MAWSDAARAAATMARQARKKVKVKVERPIGYVIHDVGAGGKLHLSKSEGWPDTKKTSAKKTPASRMSPTMRAIVLMRRAKKGGL